MRFSSCAAARARARAREGYHSDDAFVNKKNFAPARSKTFGFEKRAKSRPKPIAQVKMEQDLEMKRREGEKETTNRVKANKVSASTNTIGKLALLDTKLAWIGWSDALNSVQECTLLYPGTANILQEVRRAVLQEATAAERCSKGTH